MPRPRVLLLGLLIVPAFCAAYVRGDDAGDLVNKAIVAYNQKRYPDAIALYAKALQLINQNSEAAAIVNHRVGQAEAADGRAAEAEKHYAMALEIYARFPAADPLKVAVVHDDLGALYRLSKR